MHAHIDTILKRQLHIIDYVYSMKFSNNAASMYLYFSISYLKNEIDICVI